MFKRVLVANRGEIAVRVMRTLREMGISPVAVYSDADRDAMHVRFADHAVHIGPSPARESYLVIDKVIAAAKESGAEAIHPGYGFLSENAGFARKVREAGMTLIGPTPEAMEIMGSKIGAKQAVKQFNVPLVPGIDEAIQDANEALRIAREVGFPVLIKASAGGGGKGMRVVNEESEFMNAMQMAVGEQIENFKKFPPRQKPASFNLDAVMRQLQEAGSGANH